MFKKLILVALLLSTFQSFAQAQETNPCGSQLGQLIKLPADVTEPGYYTELINNYDCDKDLQAQLFVYRARVKYQNSDNMGAMVDFTKSIETKPTDFAYFHRGVLKGRLNDLKGAIADFDKAIGYCNKKASRFRTGGPTEVFHTDIYEMRGKCYFDSQQYSFARRDFDELVKLDNKYMNGYLYRGMSEYQLGEKEKACSDWRRAGELGNEKAYEYLQKLCQ